MTIANAISINKESPLNATGYLGFIISKLFMISDILVNSQIVLNKI